MTRKHFEALAAALKDSKPSKPDPESTWSYSQYRDALAQWRIDVRAIVSACLRANDQFDARFYAACGYKLSQPV